MRLRLSGPAGLPVAVGVAAGLVCWLTFRLAPGTGPDLDQNLVTAQALLAGENPYLVAGRGSFFYPLLYPLPAILLITPLAPLPLELGRALFAAVSAAAFAVAAPGGQGARSPRLRAAHERPYDELALFLIPRTKWEGYALGELSLLAAFLAGWLHPRWIGTPLEVNPAARSPVMFLCRYLPALVMALRAGPARSGRGTLGWSRFRGSRAQKDAS